jgi:hypothetical protein
MKTHPRPGWIYILNLFGLPFPLTTDALILGQTLTFKAQVDDSEGVDKVEFFIDGMIFGETNETAGLLQTYNYPWEYQQKGSYNLKIRAYNTYGGTCKEELTIRKLL